MSESKQPTKAEALEALEEMQAIFDRVIGMSTDRHAGLWGFVRHYIEQAGADARQQEAVAHVFSDDLKRLKTSECSATIYSVEMGDPDRGETMPLYEQAGVVPEGWQLVPVVPTREMLLAITPANDIPKHWVSRYADMLEASPKQEADHE